MEYRKISTLKKLPNNPRVIKNNDFSILCKSIQDNPDYFEARPIVLSDRTGELIIIAGNQRFEAAKHLKLKEVPTFLIKNLTEKREREIIIRDNISNGEWDFEAIANEWNSDELQDWGLFIPQMEEEEPEEEGNSLPKEENDMIAITLTEDELEAWLEVKKALNCKKDKPALIKLIEFFKEKKYEKSIDL